MNLKEKYHKEIVPTLMKNLGYENPTAVPKITKVVVNTGFGRQAVAATNEEQKKIQESIITDLALICGQRPVLTEAKKAIASFKLRKGMIVGAKVTLRGKRMYDFLERLINFVLPRTRDFRGIAASSIDQGGNLTLAIKEHISFPEVSPEKSRINFGLGITVATTARDKKDAENLFRAIGFPIK